MLEYVDETSCHFHHAFCHGSILTPLAVFATVTVILLRASGPSSKHGSSAGERRGKRSNGWLRISKAIHEGHILNLSFLHTDAFDVLNVGFNFHSQPSHDVFGIGLCQKSDAFCHDELLGEDFRNSESSFMRPR